MKITKIFQDKKSRFLEISRNVKGNILRLLFLKISQDFFRNFRYLDQSLVVSYLLNTMTRNFITICKPKPATRGGTQRMSEATIEQLRASGPCGAEGHLPHHIFADELTLFQLGGRLCPPYWLQRVWSHLIPGLLVPLDKRSS